MRGKTRAGRCDVLPRGFVILRRDNITLPFTGTTVLRRKRSSHGGRRLQRWIGRVNRRPRRARKSVTVLSKDARSIDLRSLLKDYDYRVVIVARRSRALFAVCVSDLLSSRRVTRGSTADDDERDESSGRGVEDGPPRRRGRRSRDPLNVAVRAGVGRPDAEDAEGWRPESNRPSMDENGKKKKTV